LTTESRLRINRFLSRTRVEGPGDRAAVWVQGCPIHCEGCVVPELWPFDGGEEVSVGELSRRIIGEEGLEGVTFTGGEPFAQAAPLAELGRVVREAGMSVLTFSGYSHEHLVSAGDRDWDDLLAVTDLLLDGPFSEESFDLARPWVGSANQGFQFLTPRYRHLESKLSEIKNRLEVRFDADGTIRVNGMTDFRDLTALFQRLT
jgi:anaerobic ribonucleoside-triphosphate reductase activating protein